MALSLDDFGASTTTEKTVNINAFASQDNLLINIPVENLIYNDEYERYTGEQFNDMVESIKKNGILQPLIVRAMGDGNFVILSGNNRRSCGEAAGLTTFPCVVKENLTDEQAQAYIDETNVFQRGFDKLKISKQAEVVARRHSQMFDQEKLAEIQREVAALNGEKVQEADSGDKKSKLAQVGAEYQLGKTTIARLIRINALINELKPMVDTGRIAVRCGVDISYLSPKHQKKIASLLSDTSLSIDMRKAELLKKLNADKKLKDDIIEQIIRGTYNVKTKKKTSRISLKPSLVKKYFPESATEEEIIETIDKALAFFFADKGND